MEEITGKVVGIRFRGDNDFFIAQVAPGDGRGRTVVGNIPGGIDFGDRVQVQGAQETHPKFGPQIKIESAVVLPPEGHDGVRTWLSRFNGIGPVKAREIADDLDGQLPNDVKVLLHHGVDRDVAEQIIEEASTSEEKVKMLVWLQDRGLSSAMASRVWNAHKSEARMQIERNPYDALLSVDGFGFKKTDEFALANGTRPDSKVRARAALAHILRETADSTGSTKIHWEEVQKQSRNYGIPSAVSMEVLQEFVQRGKVHSANPYISDLSLYNAERGIALHVRRILKGSPHGDIKPQLEGLTEGQKEAVKLALDNPFAAIIGPPGVGKTYTAKFIMDALSEHPDDVLCCAPTGKAAQRLKESTGYDAQTIHRGFGYHPVYGWPDIPVPYNKVMIDEGSMIDAELASTIFRLIPDDAQVVWLGDPNQLPAVGPGDVLRDMTRIEDIPTAEITQIVRQAEDSVIVKNAHNILNQRELEFSMGPGVEGGVYGKWFNDNADSSKIAEEIPKWLDVAAKSYQLDPKDVQVLIPGKKGACGVKEVNEILSNHLNPRVDGMTVRKLPNGHTIAPGDKVINTKNNYDEWVFNGDWGFVREISTGKKTSVTIEWDAGKEGTVTKTISGSKKLSAIIPAWAITVHRSQGSEYPVVFIIAVREHTFMWSSQLLYTAMTRAKRGVYIAGQRRTIKNALSKRGRQQRNTNLVQIWEGSKNA